MKFLNLLLVGLTALLSNLALAGVGGTSGGHVHFQKDSTFVSVLYNKTLCVKDGYYFATVQKCLKEKGGDNGGCNTMTKKQIYQPIVSKKNTCAAFSGGDNDHCDRWEVVPYVQEPVFHIDPKDYDKGSPVKKKQIIQVPNCKN